MVQRSFSIRLRACSGSKLRLRMVVPPSINIGQRVLDLAYERGLIVYFRRVKGGVQGDCVMVAPPLIVTSAEIGEIVSILGDAIAAAAGEFGLPVNG